MVIGSFLLEGISCEVDTREEVDRLAVEVVEDEGDGIGIGVWESVGGSAGLAAVECDGGEEGRVEEEQVGVNRAVFALGADDEVDDLGAEGTGVC